MNTKEALITLQDVSVTYPTGTHALQQINLQVGKGEFVFVVGSSGSGKSTFIKTLLGEVKATHGKIFVAKKQLDRIKRKELPYYRRILGVVFQEFHLLKDRNDNKINITNLNTGIYDKERNIIKWSDLQLPHNTTFQFNNGLLVYENNSFYGTVIVKIK